MTTPTFETGRGWSSAAQHTAFNMGQFESLPLGKALEKDREEFGRGEGTVLNLQGLCISGRDAATLAETFKNHQSLGKRLQLVQLGACSLTPRAIHSIALGVSSTRIANTITRIDLSTSSSIPEGNPLGNEGAVSIAQFIRGCKSLQHMKAASCQLECEGMADIASAVSGTRSLRTLDLSYNSIGDAGAKELGSALADNESLQGFSLWRNLITSEGCKYLAEGLGENSSLKWLGLGCNSIGDKGVEYLMEALVDNIANCKLSWLALGNNQISDESVEKLAEFLTAGWTSIDEDEGEEGVACPVTSLGLGGNEIGDKGAKELAQALEVNDKLTSLGLSHNKISDEGAKALAEMLRNNQTLENLSLAGNRIGNDGGETLVASLCDNTTLSKLLLAQNPLNDGVCTRCIEVFSKHNLTLQVLDLNETNISTAALKNFMAQLKKSKSKINRASLGDQILTMSEKEHKSYPSSARPATTGNPLEVANWRPPPASEVPQQDIFKLADRTRNLFDRRNMVIPLKEEGEEERDGEDLAASSGSSLDLELPMFSGGLVDRGEGEGEIADINNDAPVVQLLTSSNRASTWRQSLLVEESFEIEPGDIGSDDEEENKSYDKTITEEEEETSTTIIGDDDDDDDDDEKAQKTEDSITATKEMKEILPVAAPVKFKIPRPPPIKKSDIENHTQSHTPPQTKTTPQESRIKTTAPVQQAPPSQTKEEEEDEWEETEPHYKMVPSKTTPTNTPIPKDNEEKGQKEEPHYKIVPSKTTPTNIPFPKNNEKEGQKEEPHYKIVPSKTPPTNIPIPKNNKEEEGQEEEPHYKIVTRSYKQPIPTFGYVKKEHIYDEIPRDYKKSNEKESSVEPEVVSEKAKYTHTSSDEGGEGDKNGEKEPLYDTIARQPILSSATKDRPRPPIGRRHPSISPSHSRTQISEEIEHSYVNITLDSNVFLEGSDSEGEDDKKTLSLSASTDDFRSRPLKEQWAISLKQRSGVLKMGGFIHKGYNELTEFSKTIDYNYFMAELPCNESKNRPGGPLAPSHTRVKLQRVMEDLGSDYINANFVGSPSYPKSYIIAQCPTETTTPTFWRMVWETNASVVVVLGDNEDKNNFWPQKGDYQLHPAVIMGEWYSDSLYIRTDKVTPTSSVEGLFEVAMVMHSYDDDVTEHLTLFHYSTWPQNGVPQSSAHIGYLFHHSLTARTRGPLVIVSSHGGGRAGCYGAVSVAYELLHNPTETLQPFDEDPNILDSVFKGLLSQRSGLVANQRQFDFCHRILEECLWGAASKGLGGTEDKGKGGGGRIFNIFKKKKRTN